MTIAYKYIYIDFDGVICDSVKEAYYCSYLAYHQDMQHDPFSVDDTIIKTFYAYRPFIRNGEHLVLLQHCIAHHIPLNSQDDFEAQLQQTPASTLSEWSMSLTKVRKQLAQHNPSVYRSLSTIYPFVLPLIKPLSVVDNVYILSTKATDTIQGVLRYNNMVWPNDRILSVSHISKIQAINEHRGGAMGDAAEPVMFFDDHLPHIHNIATSKQRAIFAYLADWGYTLPEWVNDHTFFHVQPNTFPTVLSTWIEDGNVILATNTTN